TLSAANPTAAMTVIRTVIVQSSHASAPAPRCPSTQRARAAAGKANARTSADTLRPAIRLLAPRLSQGHAIPRVDPNAEPADRAGERGKCEACRSTEDERRPTGRRYAEQGAFSLFRPLHRRVRNRRNGRFGYLIAMGVSVRIRP